MKHIALDRQLEALQESVHRARARTKPQVDALLAPEIGPVVYPIAWTSEKQRRAFFATNGFGRGIPTKRTGALNDGWNSFSETITGLGTRVLIWNSQGYAQFVVGRFTPSGHMQRFHRNTGWQPVILKTETIKQILIEGILKEFRWIIL
jgi:hypothetical protein